MSDSRPRTVQWHTGGHVHPVYREQLHAVPDGWTYVHTHPAFKDASAPTKKVVLRGQGASIREPLEAIAFRALSAAGYVHKTRVKPLPGVSLIHSAERLIRRSPVPYVVDVEHVDLFVLYQQATYRRPWARAALERSLLDDRLKFLLPWSDAARESILRRVSSATHPAIESKLRTVYPAARAMVDRAAEPSPGALRVLFIGTQFFAKGGVDAIKSVEMARTAGVNIELDIVTYMPSEWAARLQDSSYVRIHEPSGQELVRKLYRECDVLLFPSHMDTYGVVVGEAMGYGLPVLAPDHLALSELVRDGENGRSFPPENMYWEANTFCAVPHSLPIPASYLRRLQTPSDSYLAGICEALTGLADDKARVAELSSGALATTTTGILSMTDRRARLADIYALAVA